MTGDAYVPPPADGLTLAWQEPDGTPTETCTVTWDNEAWTIDGRLAGPDVQYVLRVSPTWQVRQFLLFRDLEEPDLWLATDGHARWGEVNGAHRPEFDGCRDVALAGTPMSHALPIRRLPLAIGDATELSVILVDVDTLGAVPVRRRYERTAADTWTVTDLDDGATRTVVVDRYGIPLDEGGRFQRVPD